MVELFIIVVGSCLVVCLGYVMSMWMDAAGNHSDPLPDNWQSLGEEVVSENEELVN